MTTHRSEQPQARGPVEKVRTYCGHWDDGHLVVEDVHNGERIDDREDDGFWDQGLWAAAGAAASDDAAMNLLAREYDARGWRWARPSERTPA